MGEGIFTITRGGLRPGVTRLNFPQKSEGDTQYLAKRLIAKKTKGIAKLDQGGCAK
jgi:hypothetical protein